MYTRIPELIHRWEGGKEREGARAIGKTWERRSGRKRQIEREREGEGEREKGRVTEKGNYRSAAGYVVAVPCAVWRPFIDRPRIAEDDDLALVSNERMSAAATTSFSFIALLAYRILYYHCLHYYYAIVQFLLYTFTRSHTSFITLKHTLTTHIIFE